MEDIFRTICFAFLCLVSVFFAPWWLTMTLLIVSIFATPYTIVFLSIAALYDGIFSDTGGIGYGSFIMLYSIGVVVLVRYIAMRYTRLAIYGREKE